MATEETPLLMHNEKNQLIVTITDAVKTPCLYTECIVLIPKSIDDVIEHEPLTYEQLLVYVNHPLWQGLRRAIMISFWLTLIVVTITACVIAYLQHGHLCVINNNPNNDSSIIIIDTSTTEQQLLITNSNIDIIEITTISNFIKNSLQTLTFK